MTAEGGILRGGLSCVKKKNMIMWYLHVDYSQIVSVLPWHFKVQSVIIEKKQKPNNNTGSSPQPSAVSPPPSHNTMLTYRLIL